MDYRPLGNSGLQISALTLGTMTFGGEGNFAKVGDTDLDGARRQIDMCLDAGINLIDTADVYSTGRSEEIVGEAIESKRDDVLISTKVRMTMGGGPNDVRALAPPRHQRLRGQPAAAAHRSHRHLPRARVGRPDPAGGDARGAAPPRGRGQGPLRRRLQLHGLAAHEGAGDRRARPPGRRGPLRLPADLLLAPGALRRVRAHPARRRPGAGHAGVEPAGRGPAVGQVPPRRGHARRLASPHRLERAARL